MEFFKNKKLLSIIVIAVLIVILGVFITVKLLNEKPKMEPHLNNHVGENTLNEEEEYFKEYLKVFGYNFIDESVWIEDDTFLSNFVIFSYLLDKKDEDFIKYNDEKVDYDSYIEIPKEEISDLIYKYFKVGNYTIQDFDEYKFYKIEVNDDIVKIYLKAVGLEFYNIETINIKTNNNKLEIEVKYTISGYDDSVGYELKFYVTREKENYFITNIEILR